MSKQMTVSEYLGHAMYLSGKTQKQIADEAGFKKPNVLSMMKQGLTKVPIYSIPALSKACGVDPTILIRMAMSEYHPEIWEVIRKNIGEPLTDEERAVLENHRAKGVQKEKA